MKAISLLLSSIVISVGLIGARATELRPHFQEETGAQTIQATKPKGDWEGTLDAGGAKLRLVLHVVRKGEQFSATLDSPDQGATGLPVDAISVKDNSIQFDMKSLGATYKGKFSSDGSRIDGEFNQMGQAFPLNLMRVDKSKTEASLLRLEKVDVGGHSLNLLIGGQGSPAVIFEGGFGAGIASWSTVQKDVATFAQTVSYDRAGLSQSEPGPKPRSAKTDCHRTEGSAAKSWRQTALRVGGPFVWGRLCACVRRYVSERCDRNGSDRPVPGSVQRLDQE